MANILTVTKQVIMSSPLGTANFNVGDTVSPGQPYYYQLLWGGFTGDTGLADSFGVPGNPSQLDDIAAYDASGAIVRHGNSELAYMELSNGASQALVANQYTLITDCLMPVPPCNRPVWIEWTAGFQMGGTVPTGGVLLELAEFTSGAQVLMDTANVNSTAAGTWTKYQQISPYKQRVGPSANWRVFGLVGYLATDAGSNLTAVIRNTTNPKTWMKAEA